jgi:hypothetical protein
MVKLSGEANIVSLIISRSKLAICMATCMAWPLPFINNQQVVIEPVPISD